MDLIIGSHVGFKKDNQLLGSALEAISYGANAFMFYTGAPQNTARVPISPDYTIQGLELMRQHHIESDNVIIHAPYIINLASTDEKQEFAIRFLKEEVRRVETLGFRKIVLHPGSHVGIGYEDGMKQIISGLNQVLEEPTNVIICLETMAGKGTECACTLEQIRTIIDGISKKENIGVCLDTCHLNDAGYDMANFDFFLEQFEKTIGLEFVQCVHVNDSKNPFDSHKDRHENIGFGTLGFDTMMGIIYHEKLKNIPKILETPYVTMEDESKERLYPPYKFEIEMIRTKEFNPSLLETIRTFYQK